MEDLSLCDNRELDTRPAVLEVPSHTPGDLRPGGERFQGVQLTKRNLISYACLLISFYIFYPLLCGVSKGFTAQRVCYKPRRAQGPVLSDNLCSS